jgi:(S)-ureidoglycine aminohydrolase
MQVFGSTRSRVCKDHALICPDSFVLALLPGWEKTQGVILIAPALGARFTQHLALMEADGIAGPPPAGVERALYVLDGDIGVKIGRDVEHTLRVGGYAFVPPNADVQIRARTATRLNVFE